MADNSAASDSTGDKTKAIRSTKVAGTPPSKKTTRSSSTSTGRKKAEGAGKAQATAAAPEASKPVKARKPRTTAAESKKAVAETTTPKKTVDAKAPVKAKTKSVASKPRQTAKKIAVDLSNKIEVVAETPQTTEPAIDTVVAEVKTVSEPAIEPVAAEVTAVSEPVAENTTKFIDIKEASDQSQDDVSLVSANARSAKASESTTTTRPSRAKRPAPKTKAPESSLAPSKATETNNKATPKPATRKAAATTKTARTARKTTKPATTFTPDEIEVHTDEADLGTTPAVTYGPELVEKVVVVDEPIENTRATPENRLEAVAEAIAGTMTAPHEHTLPEYTAAIPSIAIDIESDEITTEESATDEAVLDLDTAETTDTADAIDIEPAETETPRSNDVDAADIAPRGYEPFSMPTRLTVRPTIDELSLTSITAEEVTATTAQPTEAEPASETKTAAEPAQPNVETPSFERVVVETVPRPGASRRTTAKIVTVIITAAIFLGVGLLLGARSGQSQSSSSSTASTASVSTVTSPPVSGNANASTGAVSQAPGGTAGSNVATDLSGSANRQSALFSLNSGPVRVHYNTTGGSLTVRLLPQTGTDNGDDFLCTAACDREADLVEASGQYYLDVQSSGGSWNIQVTS